MLNIGPQGVHEILRKMSVKSVYLDFESSIECILISLESQHQGFELFLLKKKKSRLAVFILYQVELEA